MKTLKQHISIIEANDRNFSDLDRFVVINTTTNKRVQGASTQQEADSVCKTFNDHEIRNGREPVYQVRLLPRTSSSDPRDW